MNLFLKRCQGEFMRIRGIALFVLGIAVLALAYDIVVRNLVYIGTNRMLGYNLLQTVIFMFPVILWHSFSTSRNDSPARSYAKIGTPLLAVLAWGLVLVAVITVIEMVRTLIMNRIGLLSYTAEGVWAFRPVSLTYAPVGMFVGTWIEYWLPVAFWCGTVTFAEGLSSALQRSRLLVYSAVLILALVANTYLRGFAVIPHVSLAPFGLIFMLAGILLAGRRPVRETA